ncbi:tyrosine-type recombinase/integrase [Halobacteria archaeon AArc-m2/3/4]|uniref:Tyrosine-type recombinase/integrase n=1 Tax=Natronoglomus mannanivorans TaxID=2979990 RepID=A0ABT2QJ09_9EURY|nr:tyrosine-type recombinase/integrase [Halobacteria archaeon AArc-m2/3/4]
MVYVNDTGDLTGKHARRLQQVEEADIDHDDRDAILAFHESRRKDGCEPTTLTMDLSTLRCASERAPVPLTTMTKSELDNLLSLLVTPREEGGYGLDPTKGGMYNYTRALRVFFRWLDSRDGHGSFPFWEEIETTDQTVERQLEDERLTRGDIENLKEAAGRGRNTQRDRALVAFLADGPRVTLATQLRVGDVHLDDDDPYWMPNDDAVGGHKDMDRRKRTFLWSLVEVRTWLHFGHPDPDNPNAPLWTVQHYDPDRPQEGALSPDGVRAMLRKAAEHIGLEKPVNPHTFRHAAMTRLSNDEGLTPQQIQHLAGWADDRMLEIYDETTDRERNDSIRSELGMETSKANEQSTPEPEPCWNCRTLLTDERFCPSCGEGQLVSDRSVKQNALADVRDGMVEDADDPAKVKARVSLEEVLDDPEAMERIAAAVVQQID